MNENEVGASGEKPSEARGNEGNKNTAAILVCAVFAVIPLLYIGIQSIIEDAESRQRMEQISAAMRCYSDMRLQEEEENRRSAERKRQEEERQRETQERERQREAQEAEREKQEQLSLEKAKRERETASYKDMAATIVSKMLTGKPRDVAGVLESCAGNIVQFSGDFFSYDDSCGLLEIKLSEQNAMVVSNRKKIDAWTGCDNIIVRATISRGSVSGIPLRAYLLRCRNNNERIAIRGWFYGKIDSMVEQRYDENPFGLSYATQLTILVDDGELITE